MRVDQIESKTFQVLNMIRTEVEGVSGVVYVDINKPSQLVTVEWNTPATWDMIMDALTDIDYAPTEA